MHDNHLGANKAHGGEWKDYCGVETIIEGGAERPFRLRPVPPGKGLLFNFFTLLFIQEAQGMTIQRLDPCFPFRKSYRWP